MTESSFTEALLEWSTIFFRATMHEFYRFTRANNLSLAQMNVLIHLYYKGPREVMDLTELMQFSPAGASQMVERMVQMSWVLRTESPEDRRVRLVQLTGEGRKIVEASIAARQAWVDRLAAAMDPEEREAVALAVARLSAAALREEEMVYSDTV